MGRTLKLVLLGLVLSGLALSQTVPTTFESADVHVSAPSTNPSLHGGALRGSRFEVRTATMVDLISMAYNMESNKVLGGPNWLDWDRFDVAAKAPPATKQDDLNIMLQNLLADRFKLVTHKDTKAMPAYALTVGKDKPKMKPAASGDKPDCQNVQNGGGPEPYQVISCRNMTMEVFAQVLRGWGGGTYLADPVVDKTGLTGAWDFELKWTPRNRLAQAGSDGITLFDAVDKQLGLKLDAQKLPLPVLLVDSVNQKPTPNPTGVADTIPSPPPAEFEVAIIKPSSPTARGQNGRLQNGRVDIENFPLKQLIQISWQLNNNDEMIAGLPKSAEDNRYDITAKAVSAGPVNAQDIDFDTLTMMLQKLLIERFNIKFHMEDRPVSAYTMTAMKQVKLQAADPQYRTNCKSGAGTNPMLNRLITCQNTSMKQLAVALENMANGYIHAPIKDDTALDGYYDFSINFSAIGLLPGARFDPNAGAQASEPNGSITLPDALQKQLGLKLEMGKRPLPVLVFDHIDEKPTDN
jgi:uncharacterized protein (TIGR03435 family)